MRINIVGERQISYAIEMVSKLPVGEGMYVDIGKTKDARSAAQNSLLWRWTTELAGELGLTKEACHKDLNSRILAPIYLMDPRNEKQKGYAEIVASLRDLWRLGMKAQAETINKQTSEMVSSTWADVEQFSEYLDDIEKDAISKGIILSRPEDLYRDAMGREQ